MKIILLAYICIMLPGCATYAGDNLVALTSLSVEQETYKNLLKTEQMIESLYAKLELPDSRKASIERILKYDLIHENKTTNFSHEKNKVFLIKGDINISHCENSIVISTGNINISHGSNNILVSGHSVNVSHDNGSVIVVKEKVAISFANNSTIYAPGGLTVSHSKNVIAYNTDTRKTSSGYINNILIDPLFEFEGSFNKFNQTTRKILAD